MLSLREHPGGVTFCDIVGITRRCAADFLETARGFSHAFVDVGLR